MTLNQHKNRKSVIIASLKRETIGKLVNRLPDLHFLISSLPGSALRTHVSLAMSTSVLKALPGKLDIKRHSLSILYLSVTSHINCIVSCCLINVVFLMVSAFIRS